MKNVIVFLITLCPFVSFSQVNEYDILFLANGHAESGSITRISYNKQKVWITGKALKDKSYSFQDVSSINTKEGRNYVTRVYKTGIKLLFPIIEGDVELFFNEGDSRFYIAQNNSLVIVSKENLGLALLAIFGKDSMDEYSHSNNMGESYGQKYLSSVVCFMNDKKGGICVEKQQLGRLPKGSLYIGASGAGQLSRTWLEYGYWVGNDRIWLKSDHIKAVSAPIGLELAANVGRHLQVNLNSRYARTSLPDFYYGSGYLDVVNLRPGDNDNRSCITKPTVF